MNPELQSLLLLARSRAAQNVDALNEALDLLRKAVKVSPGTAAEALFQFHLSARDFQQAERVLDEYGNDLEPTRRALLQAVLSALVDGRSSRPEVLADLQPGREAQWPQLYLGILEHAQGEIASSRATLFKFLRAAFWRKDMGRNLAVDLLLQSETRRCRLCRIRKAKSYLQDDTPLCGWCARLPENPWLERLGNWHVRRSFRDKKVESERLTTPLVPILPPTEIVSVFDEDAQKIWLRTREIAEEQGREFVSSGDLGMALYECPFNKYLFSYPQDQEQAYRQASSLPAEDTTGSSDIGMELAWLLNIAHWNRRLFRGSAQFEDTRHKPIDAKLLHAAYGACHPGPHSLMGSVFAQVCGFHLSPAQAELFQSLLAEHPDSLYLHMVLASHHRRPWRQDRAELDHEIWLIRHLPFANRSLEHQHCSWPPKHRACVDAWSQAVKDNIDDPDALGQAASFFQWEHPRLSKALIDRCRELEPELRKWTGEAIHGLDKLLEQAGGIAEKRALAGESSELLEVALAHPPADHTRFELRLSLAARALRHGDFERARRAAQSLLDRCKVKRPRHAHWALHGAYTVLGVLALNEGKVEVAKEHLLDSLGSPPGDCPDALVYRLTRIFWQMGEREVLSRYLSQCRVQWPESNIEPWLTDMSARWPEFAAWANKQPRLVKPMAWRGGADGGGAGGDA